MGRCVVFRVLLVAIVICMTGCNRPNPPSQEEPEAPLVRASIAAVQEFHSAVGANQPSRVCENADPHAFEAVTKLPCHEFISMLNAKLGSIVSTRRTQVPLASARPPHVGLVYETQYQRGAAHEHFEYRVEGSRAVLTVYRVKSDLLNQ